MQWVLIAGDKDFSLKSFADMDFDGAVSIVPAEDMISVRYPDGYAVFEPVDKKGMMSEFEPGDLCVLEALPFTPENWVMLTYSDIGILRSIVSDESFPKNVFIDCDGVPLGLEDVFPQERLILTEKP